MQKPHIAGGLPSAPTKFYLIYFILLYPLQIYNIKCINS